LKKVLFILFLSLLYACGGGGDSGPPPDTTPPDTSIISNPSNPSDSSEAVFTFQSSEANSTFECNIDSGAWETCTSPKNYDALEEGTHTFNVSAIDGSGNTDLTPATYTWIIDVDNEAPDTTITSSPENPTEDTTAVFTFESTEQDSTFECSIDSGAWEGCISPKTYQSLSYGEHVFNARATDVSLNTDPTPASYTWDVVLEIIDDDPPDTTITSKPSEFTNDTNAVFEFESTEANSTFECTIDSGPWESCTSPKSYSNLEDGLHAFRVRATDDSGNTDESSSLHEWTINTETPNATITNSPPEFSSDTNVVFEFESSKENSTFECNLDSLGWDPCISPYNYSELSEALHVFEVRAIDEFGNVDESPAVHDWTVDHTPPETTITGNPDDPTEDRTAVFSFVSNEANSTFECKLDNGGWEACTSPKTYNAIPEGNHDFSVRGTDITGNQEVNWPSYDWAIVDFPETTITLVPETNDKSPTFAFESSIPESGFRCKVNAGEWLPCTSPHTYSGFSVNTDYVFQVKAVFENYEDLSPASHSWRVEWLVENLFEDLDYSSGVRIAGKGNPHFGDNGDLYLFFKITVGTSPQNTDIDNSVQSRRVLGGSWETPIETYDPIWPISVPGDVKINSDGHLFMNTHGKLPCCPGTYGYPIIIHGPSFPFQEAVAFHDMYEDTMRQPEGLMRVSKAGHLTFDRRDPFSPWSSLPYGPGFVTGVPITGPSGGSDYWMHGGSDPSVPISIDGDLHIFSGGKYGNNEGIKHAWNIDEFSSESAFLTNDNPGQLVANDSSRGFGEIDIVYATTEGGDNSNEGVERDLYYLRGNVISNNWMAPQYITDIFSEHNWIKMESPRMTTSADGETIHVLISTNGPAVADYETRTLKYLWGSSTDGWQEEVIGVFSKDWQGRKTLMGFDIFLLDTNADGDVLYIVYGDGRGNHLQDDVLKIMSIRP